MDDFHQRRTERSVRAMCHALLDDAPAAIVRAAQSLDDGDPLARRRATVALIECITRIDLVRDNRSVDPAVRDALNDLLSHARPLARALIANDPAQLRHAGRYARGLHWEQATARCRQLAAVPASSGATVWPG